MKKQAKVMEDCSKVIALSLRLLAQVEGVTLTILVLFTMANTTINMLLILSFIATKQIKKNTTNFLIFIMSINDALLSCVALPLLVVVLYNSGNDRKCMSLAQDFMSVISLLVMHSALLTTQVTLDRYLHMDPNVLNTAKWRTRFKKCFKKPQIYFMLLLNVLIAVLSAWCTYEKRKLQRNAIGVLQLLEAIHGLLGLSFLCGLYLKGYISIHRHVTQNRVHSDNSGIDYCHRSRYLRDLYKTVLLLVVTMILTYVPFLIVTGILSITRLARGYAITKELILFYSISYLLMCSNGMFNSMIIFYRNKEAKQWVFRKLIGYCCRNELHGRRRGCNHDTVVYSLSKKM